MYNFYYPQVVNELVKLLINSVNLKVLILDDLKFFMILEALIQIISKVTEFSWAYLYSISFLK